LLLQIWTTARPEHLSLLHKTHFSTIAMKYVTREEAAQTTSCDRDLIRIPPGTDPRFSNDGKAQRVEPEVLSCAVQKNPEQKARFFCHRCLTRSTRQEGHGLTLAEWEARRAIDIDIYYCTLVEYLLYLLHIKRKIPERAPVERERTYI
jgi:hypothetical protein